MTAVPGPPPRRSHGTASAVLLGLAMALVAVGVGLGPSGVTRLAGDVFGLGDGTGDYAFLQTQPGHPDVPVTYAPCEVIEVVLNPDGAPDNAEKLVRTAMKHVGGPSGLELTLVGETDERPSSRRSLEDADRYGDGYSPVLVSWADSAEIPDLAGNIAGVAGSASVGGPEGRVYVTGQVTLDREVFDDLDDWRGDEDRAQAIVDHEFGHLVGLDHVEDPGELMHAENRGQLGWGPGDLEGLARLGEGPCP